MCCGGGFGVAVVALVSCGISVEVDAGGDVGVALLLAVVEVVVVVAQLRVLSLLSSLVLSMLFSGGGVCGDGVDGGGSGCDGSGGGDGHCGK